MQPMLRHRLLRLLLVATMALFGAAIGLLMGLDPFWHGRGGAVLAHPLPHHFSKYPDGLSLRFAMVHDMIHERFPKHGPAYYQERNRQVRRQLDVKFVPIGDGPSDPRDDLLDDLVAGSSVWASMKKRWP